LGKIFKAIATTAGSTLFFYCLGCSSGTTGQSTSQQQQIATPAITQVSPQTIKAGSQSTTLKVTGTNFPAQAAILWNGAAIATTAVDSNTLSSTIASSSIAAPGTVQLKVQNTQTMQESPAVSLVIAPADSTSPLTISLTPLPQGVVNAGYTGTLGVTGGTAPYTWSIASGQLPAGLTLAPSTGIISGIPTASGTFSFGISVKDSSAQTATATVPLTIGAASAATPTVLTITSTSLPSGAIGSGYSNSLQASGGTAPYTWSFVSGNLPAGLSLNTSTGLISGTPTASGTATFTAAVTDAGSPAQNKSVTLSLVIAPATLAVATAALPSGTQSSSYSRALQATGGTSPYTWSISSGTLPAGLNLTPSTGLVSGTPTASGNFSFGVTVHDAGSPAQTASATVTLSLVAAGTPLAISSTALPGGTPNQAYIATLNATGGTAPYTWSIPPNTLPGGLSLNSSTGLISGTPTGTGTSNFTVTVADAGSPAQSKSVTLSIAVTPPVLTISASLPAGTANTAYASPMSATGGTPAYTWSIKSGSLPPGLTLAATTGIISGTPTTSGTFNFTATVSDNGSPVQSQSTATSIIVAAATPPPGPGTTWFIRPDGGSRYSANQPQGQCDGKADTAYPGTGTNQHCAFSDYRYLWDDQSYNNDAWVIAGGDTVIIRGGPWRVGWDAATGVGAGYTWCSGGGTTGCQNPTIPAGTAAQHTRILGENFGSCSATNKTQIFGGFGLGTALDLSGAQYVDLECLEITRHSDCIWFGSPAVPSGCSGQTPKADFDSDGIHTNVQTHDVLLQDMWIHGHPGRGVKGPIGGVVTCLRCDIAINGGAGWDFDDGYSTPAGPGATWNFLYSIIEWSGCNQEYPAVDPIPVASCYSQSTGGYGDGVGTPAGTGFIVNIDHSIFRYNTQDGLDLGHVDTGGPYPMSITNSIAYSNGGGTFKWGPNANPVIFTNNIAIADCRRMAYPITGTPSAFNANLSDFCRANDALPVDFRQGGTVLMANNTVVSYAPTTFDLACWDADCSNSTLNFFNNIVVGYDNPALYNAGGQVGGPGLFYFQEPIGTINRSNNIYYGIGHGFTCPTGYTNETCVSPNFLNQPTGNGTTFVPTELDNYNVHLTSGSPAVGVGMTYPNLPALDYFGATRPNPPSIGASEP
jgi:hypothetical protein